MSPKSALDRLDELVAATREAQATIRELHAAQQAARDVLKRERTTIAKAIAEEVERQIGALSDETRAAMLTAVDDVITRMATDFRTRLGLDP